MGVAWCLIGAALYQPTQALLAARRPDHPLPTAMALGSVTAVLFALLAWRVGLILLFGLAAAVERNAAAMLRSLAGMAISFTFYLIIALATRNGLGAADIRLAGLLGLALAHPDPAGSCPNGGSFHRGRGSPPRWPPAPMIRSRT